MSKSNDPNWKYEGIAYDAIKLTDCDEDSVNVFRFWSPTFKSHFYTSSASEKDKLIATDSNWTYEGIAFCTVNTEDLETPPVPVYRFWSSKYQSHFMTKNGIEKTKLINSDTNWKYEGIAFYSVGEEVDHEENPEIGAYTCASDSKFIVRTSGTKVYTLDQTGARSEVEFNPQPIGTYVFSQNNVIAYRAKVLEAGKSTTQLFICNINTGINKSVGIIPADEEYFSFSNDGSKLFYIEDNKIHVYVIAKNKWIILNIPAGLRLATSSWEYTNDFIFTKNNKDNSKGLKIFKISTDGDVTEGNLPDSANIVVGFDNDYIYFTNKSKTNLFSYNPVTNAKKTYDSEGMTFSKTGRSNEITSIAGSIVKLYELDNDDLTVKDTTDIGNAISFAEARDAVQINKNIWSIEMLTTEGDILDYVIDFDKNTDSLMRWHKYIESIGGDAAAQNNYFSRIATGFNGFSLYSYDDMDPATNNPMRLVKFDVNGDNPEILLVH